MARASKKVEAEDGAVQLERVQCIHYPIRFQKDSAGAGALFDSGSEINAMTPAFALKLGLKVRPTNVRAQKIDGSSV